MVRIEGKTFSDEILARIRETVEAEPTISRTRLSQKACEWLNWRNAVGRLQEMSCRKAMLELHRRQLIPLPAPRRCGFQERRQAAAPPPAAAVACSLNELGPVEIVPVR